MKALTVAVSRWWTAQQAEICQRFRPAGSSKERITDAQHFSLRYIDNQLLMQRFAIPISSVGLSK